MPPLTFRGFSFLFGWDDLCFPPLITIPFHLVWILVDTTREAAYLFDRRGVNTVLLYVDAALCLVVALLDAAVGILAAQGAIMERRRHEKLLSALVVPRFLLGTALIVIYLYAIVCITASKLQELIEVEDTAFVGWGAVDERYWVLMLVQIAFWLRIVVAIPGFVFVCISLIPSSSGATLATGAIKRVLRFMGVRDSVISELIGVLIVVVGTGTVDLVVPSDFVFGLALVAARQLQGAVYSDGNWDKDRENDDPESLHPNIVARRLATPDFPPSAVRASMIQGVNRAPVPLNVENSLDMQRLQEVLHFVAYSTAIYGSGMECFVSSVSRHTSIPSFGKSCHWFWSTCRTCALRRKYKSPNILGDCCSCHRDAFLRLLQEQADRTGTEMAELIWATWLNRGALSAPPIAVVLDHVRRCVVVCIRGTMDAKDLIADLGAIPCHFDPLKMGGEDANKEAPFDDERDCFAHSTMVMLAEDAMATMEEAGILDELLQPHGRAHGWDIVVTGHSLGAGVSTILALMLRGSDREYAQRVRAIVFEPPGGLLSSKLSKKTGDFGFVAAVCSHDWISRLSVRAVQELREQVLDELHRCDRSKWQLSLLMLSRACLKVEQTLGSIFCCLCLPMRWLSTLLLRMAGGPLPTSSPTPPGGENSHRRSRQGASILRQMRYEAERKNRPATAATEAVEPGLRESLPFFNELWPPRDVMYFRPTSLSWKCCSTWPAAHHWVAEWIEPQDLCEMIISPKSVELHFPNILRDAYFSAAAHLGVVDADWTTVGDASSQGSTSDEEHGSTSSSFSRGLE